MLEVTQAMERKLRKHGIQPERGIFNKRVWEYSRSRFVGSPAFAEKLYEEHINPGHTGEKKERHKEKWIHEAGLNQTSLFSLKHKLQTGASP